MSGGPVASVVIPACNEAEVIDRCLAPLAEAAASGALEVVVCCNGCTDDTAGRARAHPGVTVLERSEPSKAQALNAADRVATAYPRFYVDADVEVDVASIETVARALREEGKPCGAPAAHFLTHDRPFPVRAFYRVWTAQPYLRDAPVGNGVYALTQDGRRRFDHFPDLVADDLFVRNLFTVGSGSAHPRPRSPCTPPGRCGGCSTCG